jgi:hypothetical protein
MTHSALVGHDGLDADTVPVEMLIIGRCWMDDRTDVQRRLDLHNISIDFAAASAGRCGFTHLDSGRVCLLPHRHLGPCQLQDQRRDAEHLAGALLG